MAALELLLSRLDGVRQCGSDYVAKCPAHDDRSPSLTVAETPDGRILLHCFAGCEALAVLEACGLSWADVMPPDAGAYRQEHRVRRPFGSFAVLHAVAKEALVVQICAAALAEGTVLPEEDRQRLVLAGARLHEALDMVRGDA
jgi:hypothetical protein